MERMMKDSEYEKLRGPQLGNKGTSRTVYEANGLPNRVIKSINAKTPATNFLEWYIYAGVKDTQYGDLFAECFSISETGKFLIMEKLEPLTQADISAFHGLGLPVWFKDKKPENFGKAGNGKIKCLDYGMVDFPTLLNLNKIKGQDYFT